MYPGTLGTLGHPFAYAVTQGIKEKFGVVLIILTIIIIIIIIIIITKLYFSIEAIDMVTKESLKIN